MTEQDKNIPVEPDKFIITELPDKETTNCLAELFKIFSDNTRVRILTALIGRERCVYNLSEELEMEQSAISHQLRVLRSSGLVKATRNGREMVYSLNDNHVKTIFAQGLEHIEHERK